MVIDYLRSYIFDNLTLTEKEEKNLKILLKYSKGNCNLFRKCSKCGQEKFIAEFGNNQYYCKECRSKARRMYYERELNDKK